MEERKRLTASTFATGALITIVDGNDIGMVEASTLAIRALIDIVDGNDIGIVDAVKSDTSADVIGKVMVTMRSRAILLPQLSLVMVTSMNVLFTR